MQSHVIPNSFAEGEGERDLTLRLHHHERKQDYDQRFRRVAHFSITNPRVPHFSRSSRESLP
jgi:hypothetical protein